MNLAEQMEKLTLAHKELVEAHETSKAALIDSESKLAASAVEMAKMKADHATALESAEKAKADACALATALRAENETLKATNAAQKAKMELTPGLEDVTPGSDKAIESGDAGAASVDHKKAYDKIADPRARAEYRMKFGKELGIVK